MNQSGWINAKERLPEASENDIEYLVIVSGKAARTVSYIHGYALAGYSESGWYIEDYPEWTDPQVEWWMPLPEAPEA